MSSIRRIAAVTVALVLVWAGAALAFADPAGASLGKQACLKPISAAFDNTAAAISDVHPRIRTQEAASEINNAIVDCLLQPGAVNRNLEAAKHHNAKALKLYSEGRHGEATSVQGMVASALLHAEDAVR
jgi:hypothetical protein